MICTTIDLWEGLNYSGEMDDGFRPKMTTYIRGGNKSRGIVIIFPGGGYGFTSPREAEPVAVAFNDAGYHAVYVDYSVAPRRHPAPLLDAARALTIIKERAKEWHVDLSRIFLCGFSAGGHLCASLSNLYTKKWVKEAHGIHLDELMIKGSILAYPVLVYGKHMHQSSFANLLGEDAKEEACMSMSMDKCVHPSTPPTFLWHTVEDKAVPVENSLIYATALRQYDIPFEMHVYQKGSHGLSLSNTEVAENKDGVLPHVASWMRLCIEWMDELT